MRSAEFYVVGSDAHQAQQLLVCRLIAKLHQSKNKIYIHCASLREAQAYDELLWTFEDDSFIPHHLVDEGLSPPPSVQLGYPPHVPTMNDVLFNLNAEIPVFYKQFRRILEIVPYDKNQRELSRQHYRFYQQEGLRVGMHEETTTQA